MGITQRVNSLLNYEIKIDLEQRIDRKRACIIIGIVVAFVIAVGYVLGTSWFWIHSKNYYEYQIEEIIKHSGDSGPRAELAMADYLNGDISKAVSSLKEVLAKEPKNYTASMYLGLILSDQKEYLEAIRLLTNYVKQNQGFETRMVYLYIGRDYLAIGKPDMSVQYLGYAAIRDPGNPLIYFSLGQAYEKMKDKKKAIASYEKALELSPNYVEADVALKNLITK